MPSSTMWITVLQATALSTLSRILNHQLSGTIFGKIFDQILEDEGFRNWTNATVASAGFKFRHDAGNTTNSTLSLNQATSPINETATNGTLNAIKSPSKSFYGQTLPREVLILVVVGTLQYCWFIWLERMLPARPRRREVPYEQKEKVEESEDREEEVVKKWIAQGRVRRASLNWCNTFLKWVLELTVGRLWRYTVGHTLEGLLTLQSPKTILGGLGVKHLLVEFFSSFISTGPLVELVAFIIIPAHKQIVFIAGADLVVQIFLTMVIRNFANWAVKTEFVQSAMRNMTEEREKWARFERFEAERGRHQRYDNEL